jgi:hypothetical protein
MLNCCGVIADYLVHLTPDKWRPSFRRTNPRKYKNSTVSPYNFNIIIIRYLMH